MSKETGQIPSLNDELAALHATRVASWKHDDLRVNVEQRQKLVDGFNTRSAVRNGTHLEDFSLIDTETNRTTSLAEIVKDGLAVFIFFRFAGCPACNIALPYYQRELLPALEAIGIALVAISPQPPERLIEIKTRHGLGFPVLSDPKGAAARKLGLLYQFDDASRQAVLAKGGSIRDSNDTDVWELPMPTVILVDADRVVRFIDISPDWLVRTEAPAVLDAIRSLRTATRTPADLVVG